VEGRLSGQRREKVLSANKKIIEKRTPTPIWDLLPLK
jgi:hypothetical protein